MPGDQTRTIASRVAADLGMPELLDVLGDEVSGADLTSVLLDVMAGRVTGLTPRDLMKRHEEDRFVSPSAIGLQAIRRAEGLLLDAVPSDFEQVLLAPLVPLGTHHVLGETPQNNVISTIRRSEVAADPTAGLALEAAVRRRRLLSESPRSAEPVKLATVQRATRGQTFAGPRSFAHFGLLGLVSAGRDVGGLAFEKEALVEHVASGVDGCRRAGADEVFVTLTDFSDRMGAVVDHACDALANVEQTTIAVDQERTHARGYYPAVCMKIHARFGEQRSEYGDGGFVDWGGRLLGNAKERMMISGMSIDRIALDLDAR